MAESQGTSRELGYEKQHPRINKPDMFMNTALLMERSPQAESPDSFVSNFQEGKKTEEAPAAAEPCEFKDGSKEGMPVTQASTETQVTSEQEAPPENQGDAKNLSLREKPVLKESSNAESAAENTIIKCNKSGAVVVLPNDRALSVDCSRDGVHAAVSALNKFGQERAKGCQVYLSRRPCSYCAKLLVQCEVAKVYYLPIEPELNDETDVERVDKLFKASSSGLSVFIPKVSSTVIDGQKNRNSPYINNDKGEYRDDDAVIKYRNELLEEYWSEEWITKASIDLKWTAFSDQNMKNQASNDMHNLMDWIARATVGDVPDKKFVEINPITYEGEPIRQATSEYEEQKQQSGAKESIPNIPTPNEASWQKHALYMSRMAQMLSQRSDDPTKPVGCVLMVHGEVIAIGWNGFPAKALYGEFPRASTTHRAREKKEPYVIHAEQNALLTRNKRNLNHKSSILYSNKIPCGECVPLLVQAGVKNVVVPCEPLQDNQENKAFFQALRKEKLKAYWPTSRMEAEPEAAKAKKVLEYEDN